MTNIAKAIMICATGSGVGKSVITAGLGRIFYEDGFKVAPFKSQNMALNSYVTKDGKEMARAQAFQAKCCRIEPTSDMNPILIKPIKDTKAQIIVNGEAIGNYDVRGYDKYKKRGFKVAKRAFMKLQRDYEIIVMEGAGSPAEINLKNDIANLKMASFAKAPVILAGDIDYGGVFAWLVGTLELLGKKERQQIKGFVINKFRGDYDILKPGLRYLTKRTGIPVLGVIPYIHDLRVEEEDSIPKNLFSESGAKGKKTIEIKVLSLPHISNFTDFDCFNLEPDVKLSYIKFGEKLGPADLLIIPGTKHTIGDTIRLDEYGYAKSIKKLAFEGAFIVGLCGGYQILGRKIYDNYGYESQARYADGLGLLDIETEFKPKKIVSQVEAEPADVAIDFLKSECKFYGYEIHMGRTHYLSKETKPLFKLRRISPQGKSKLVLDGAINKKGNVIGTYIHGIFDNPDFRSAFLNRIRRKKGIKPKQSEYSTTSEEEISSLAKTIRDSLDLKAIYNFLGLRPKWQN